MAYMSQDKKKELTPAIKAICKKHKVKATLSVRNHSTLVLTVTEGAIDFGSEYAQVNPYWYQEHYTGKALAFLSDVLPAMNVGNFDRSEPQTDFFCVGWYVNVNIGRYNKPYHMWARGWQEALSDLLDAQRAREAQKLTLLPGFVAACKEN